MKRWWLGNGWPLFVVIVVAAIARLWVVDAGLPYVTDADEPNNLSRTVAMLESGGLNPGWFHYPSALFYLYGGILAIAAAWRGSTGVPTPQLIADGTGVYPETWALIVPRLTTVVLSVATIAVVYLVVNRVTRKRWPAVLGGLLLGLSPLAATQGRLFAPDTLSGLFAAAAVWGAYRVYDYGLVRDYVVAGALVGLATGAKYNAGLAGVMVIVAHVYRMRERRDVYGRGVLVAVYASLAAFLVTTPFAILDSSTFLGDIGFELVHYSTGHTGAVGGLSVYLTAIGASFSVALVLTIFGLANKDLQPYAVTVLVFAVGYTVFISIFPTTFVRNLIPAMPAYAIAIGIGAAGAERLTRRSRRGLAVGVGLVAILAATGFLVADHLSLPDRTAAREWISESIPPGSVIVVERNSPWVDPTIYEIQRVGFVIVDELPADWDFIFLAEEGSGRFLAHPDVYPTEVLAWSSFRDRTCSVRVFDNVVDIRAPDCSFELTTGQ